MDSVARMTEGNEGSANAPERFGMLNQMITIRNDVLMALPKAVTGEDQIQRR